MDFIQEKLLYNKELLSVTNASLGLNTLWH